MGAGLDFVIYGLLIMIIAVYQPGGIVGAFNSYTKKRKKAKRQIVNQGIQNDSIA